MVWDRPTPLLFNLSQLPSSTPLYPRIIFLPLLTPSPPFYHTPQPLNFLLPPIPPYLPFTPPTYIHILLTPFLPSTSS